MKNLSLSFIFLFIVFSSSSQPEPGPAKEIAEVLKKMENFRREERKKDSTAKQPLGSFSTADFERRYRFYKNLYDELSAAPVARYSFQDQINTELLLHQLKDEVSTFEYRSYFIPILADEGFHTSLARWGNTQIQSRKDADNYLALLRDVPRYVDAHLQLMKSGLSEGITQPQAIFNGYETTYRQHLVDSVEKSVFWRPLLNRPAAIAISDWENIREGAAALIMKNVVPAYQRIGDFFEKEYMPQTRKTIGISEIPNGKAYYEDRVRHYTSTNLTSEEVYQVGLREVARIDSAMKAVLLAVNFHGTVQDFIRFLRTDPQFYPKTADELLKEASFIAKKVDGQLPSLFGKLPRQPYTVTPVPDYLAPSYTAGRYSGAPIESKRPGQYWVNTYNLSSRTLYTLEALTLHEAVPGHHLQIALTKELDHLPAFRRNLYINAFGEGWGLYSEYLGHEMGFYQDPYSLFGRLTYDMWRACRLVIDVGIHVKGWTREQAVSYLADHTALSLHEVNTEVNRYISWPGQALAYKMGEITIRECRERSEAALGTDFDVRGFHDMVLSNGAVTLSILQKMTDRFIAEQMKKKKN